MRVPDGIKEIINVIQKGVILILTIKNIIIYHIKNIDHSIVNNVFYLQ